MPILLTEVIDINTKMSDIDVQQPLDDKCVADCLLETKIDAKVEEVKKVASSGDAIQSARLTIAANNYGQTDKTNEYEEIEHFTQNKSMGINKCTEDKNSTLQIYDKKYIQKSVVEETIDSDIAIGVPVAKKTDDRNGVQIRVENLFENGEENKSAENVAKCISSPSNKTLVRNELVDYQVLEDKTIKHEDVSLSETETKDSENPQGCYIEKINLFEDDLNKNGELLKPEGKSISEYQSFDKETRNKTAEAESKPSEVKSKGIVKISPSQTNKDSYNSQIQSMERDLTSEMMTNEIKCHENYSPETNLLVNKIKHKDTISVTFTAQENCNTNKVNSIEQTCLSQAKSLLIVNYENEYILLEKNISEVVANGKNVDEVVLPEGDIMEQDPLLETDNMIVKNNVHDTIFQNNKQVFDNFAAKDSSVPNGEVMKPENTSQEDVVDSPMKESEKMKKEMESPEDKNGEDVSESYETGHPSTSTTDEITSPDVSHNNTRELKDTSSEKLDGFVETYSIEGKKQEQTVEEIQVSVISDDCTESIPKLINISSVKSPTEINKSSCAAEIDFEKKTIDIDPTESHKIDEEHNDLETPARPVEGQSKESNIMHKSEKIFKSMVIEDTNEETEAEATKIKNHINDSNKKERNSAEQSNTPDQNEDTKVKNSEREREISEDEFVLNYSDEECEVDLKDKNNGPSKTEAILDTVIGCVEVDNCTESIPKLINISSVKSPTEINKGSCAAGIDVNKKTIDIDPTESREIEEIDEEHNDLETPARPVEGQSKESNVMHKSEKIFKSMVIQDTNEEMEAEATKIENHINDSSKKERNSAEQSNIPDQNEDTIVKNSERESEISEDEFVLNYSDEECEVDLKDKNNGPSKTEEILDTGIGCVEVDRGGKKRVIETDDLDIVTVNKTDIPQLPDVTIKRLCNFSNTLDILSDADEQESEKKIMKTTNVTKSSKNSINIYDDDDIMLIDGDPISKEGNAEKLITKTKEINEITSALEETKKDPGLHKEKEPDLVKADAEIITIENPHISRKPVQHSQIIKKLEEKLKPLVPENFLKSFKNNVADMTRENIEELCLQLIVEGVVDRINFSEIKTKLKTMSSSMDEWRKKTMILTKQNRDLQIVLKTVQEEQKKRNDGAIVPLKITRSVGIQVYIADNERGIKRKNPSQTPPNNRNTRNAPNPNPKQQQQKLNTQIPVPRLVPATCNSPAKNTRPSTPQVQNTTVTSNSGVKTSSPHPLPSGLRNSPPVKPVEKRPFSSVQSVTVDLTDDEPPSKQQVTARNAPQPPVRLVAQNQLLSARAQNQNNGPRKVYIPINSQNQTIRPGQTIMLKSVPPGVGPRPRNQRPMVTIPSNAPVRMPRHNGNHRHPAPLPDVAKQQQPPNWKALPPSPDLKISKVVNGIVISWKIEGYQEDSYEQIAGYQLYAYQETASPPSTQLWKKIGDVKALPLPMACTLTQFMAGYKYFFAVRAIDVRSRIGPFSLPGSILLLNK